MKYVTPQFAAFLVALGLAAIFAVLYLNTFGALR